MPRVRALKYGSMPSSSVYQSAAAVEVVGEEGDGGESSQHWWFLPRGRLADQRSILPLKVLTN